MSLNMREFTTEEAALALMGAETMPPDVYAEAMRARPERRGCVDVDTEARAAAKLAAAMAARKQAAIGRLHDARVAPRRDLCPRYVADLEALNVRDAARYYAARYHGADLEAERVGRIVVARCFGLYPHPHGKRAAAALVAGDGDTAAGWRW